MKKILVHLQTWYGCYTLLFLLIITSILWSWRDSGRYQLCNSLGNVYVIDTKTSQLWARFALRIPGSGTDAYDLGTNEKPNKRLIEMPKPKNLSTEEILRSQK